MLHCSKGRTEFQEFCGLSHELSYHLVCPDIRVKLNIGNSCLSPLGVGKGMKEEMLPWDPKMKLKNLALKRYHPVRLFEITTC